MQTNLIAIRRFKGITQKDMAHLLKIDIRTYVNKENGNSQFKLNEMFIIAKHFQKELSEIFLPTNFMKHEVLAEEVNQ